MKKILIACETIQDEVNLVLKRNEVEIPIQWMDNNLHAYPEKLREALQKEIDQDEKTHDHILFAYGNCGNGLLGLKSEKATMIIPKYGDCIDLLLCEKKNLERIRTTTYFLTPGWLRGDKSLDKEYDYNLNKYGEKRAKMIMTMMFKNYKHLMLIETGAFDRLDVLPQVENIARLLNLETIISSGSVTPLEKLITEDWKENFCIIPPGRFTNYEDFEGI